MWILLKTQQIVEHDRSFLAWKPIRKIGGDQQSLHRRRLVILVRRIGARPVVTTVRVVTRAVPVGLCPRLLVAEAAQEQSNARLEDHRQPFDVGTAVVVAEDVKQAAVDQPSP